MKKTTFPAFLSTAIVAYIFWLLVTGHIVLLAEGHASVQVLIAGIFVAAGVGLFAARFFVHESAFYLWNPKHLFPGIFYCLIRFPWELLKANWDVAKRALSPKCPVNPGIVKIRTDLKSDYGIFALTSSITLTPGTITMECTEEDGENYLYIHWIDVGSTDVEEASDMIKGGMEKWLRRIWK